MPLNKRTILLFCLCILLLTCIACKQKVPTQKDNVLTIKSFQLNKDFEVMNFEQDNHLITLTVKSDRDITEYVSELTDKFLSDNFTFYIYLFHTNENNPTFSTDNLTNFRGLITFRTDMNKYTLQKYIILPQIEMADTLSAFTNKDVKNENDLLTVSIELNIDEMSLSDLVSQLKLYVSFIQKENKLSKAIKVIVNDTYIYESENYIIQKISVDF